jgi:hypothetical protein
MKDPLELSVVNGYLAHKQRLLPTAWSTDIVQAARDLVALHATGPTGPYLSLWARMARFQRQVLDEALYDRRTLVRVLCMRTTLHVVASDEVACFVRAYGEGQGPGGPRSLEPLLVQAGLCGESDARMALQDLQQRVLDALAQKGPATVRQLSRAVPELRTKVPHSVGKSYEGEFSLGSRLVPAMCAQGLLIRARPRGTWRSNLYEYAAFSDWLPEVDLAAVSTREARIWLVRRYLSAFGPATFDDVVWWTGFSKGETREALRCLEPEIVEIAVQGLDAATLALAQDAQRLQRFVPPETAYTFLLPGLDPYIMGYQDRRRFLDPEHRTKVFDRAGNATPTVWARGRVVGAWGQREDGSIVYGLVAGVGDEVQQNLAEEVQRLEGFLGGEYLPQRTHTPFTRSLT